MNQSTSNHLALGRTLGCLAGWIALGSVVLGSVVLATAAGAAESDPQTPVDPTVQAVSYVGDISRCDAGCCDDSCGGGHCSGGQCGGFGCGCSTSVGLVPRGYGRPDLFYNFYTQGYYNRANAQMYLSPLPIPPNVGHTFYTYQPFYPHHMLYWHSDRFHRYYDNGRGFNRTHAVYYSPPVRSAIKSLYWNLLRIPR